MTWFEYDDKYYTYKTADVKDGKVTKDFTVEGLEKLRRSTRSRDLNLNAQAVFHLLSLTQ